MSTYYMNDLKLVGDVTPDIANKIKNCLTNRENVIPVYMPDIKFYSDHAIDMVEATAIYLSVMNPNNLSTVNMGKRDQDTWDAISHRIKTSGVDMDQYMTLTEQQILDSCPSFYEHTDDVFALGMFGLHWLLKYSTVSYEEYLEDLYDLGGVYGVCVYSNENYHIEYTTAHGIGEKLLLAISKKFPNIEFTLKWRTEYDNDSSVRGIIRFKNGERVNESPEGVINNANLIG